MKNLEQAMREAAAALTGQAVETIPSGPLEEICTFIAENYQAPKNVPFVQVSAPADAAGETPTKVEFNNLIKKLKDAKVFK